MSFGVNFKRILKENNLKIKEVHEGTNIPLNTLYSITKRNTKIPNKDTIKKILKYLQERIGPEITIDLLISNPPARLINENADKFTTPSSTQSIMPNTNNRKKDAIIIDTDIDQNHPYNIIMKKKQEGIDLTQEEKDYLNQYAASFDFLKPFRKISDVIKRLEDSISDNYELLNEAGQKKADEEIDRTAKQIELLTKIPEYRKEEI